ncbi:hypothetical protein MBLNU459_g2431t2 [Dothideomycetes sp. NU459]
MFTFSPRAIAGSICVFAATCAVSASPTAFIENGMVVGTTTSLPAATATVNKFLGIPFAQSPPRRFTPPQPAAFMPMINATAWKPACIQQFVSLQSVFDMSQPSESEDCLYLNVYAPSTPSTDLNGRAVLFWIYGGALQFGNAGQPTYDGSAFASYEDVILVAPNYRTNVFGFPSSPELPVTGHNLGFLDQRFALEWVQRNIRAFGGDPAKVTIFGESAGGWSVDSILTSYPKNSKPPFRGAIMESGQFSYRPSLVTSSVPAWNSLSAALGCPGNYSSDLACVRAADAYTIRSIIDTQDLVFNPIADNVTSVSNPSQMRLSGNIANIPVLQGTNAQEGRVFLQGFNNITQFVQAVFGASPVSVADVLAAYPLGSNGLNTPYDVISQIFTEWYFQCPAALNANATASVGIPSWRYYFNASFANTQLGPNLGVYHSSEIPIVFSTYPTAGTTTQEYALSELMRATWARFAKNPRNGPGWNAVGTGAAGPVLTGANASVVDGIYLGANSSALHGDWDLGVFGNVGNVMAGGVTVLPQSDLDQRCAIFLPIYQSLAVEPV